MHQSFSLENKNILVTGAAGHLGSAISLRLLDAGAHIIINGRDKQKLEKFVAQHEQNKSQITILSFDISDENAVDGAVASIKNQFGTLDGLVNNAFAPLSGSIETATDADFNTCFSVNVTATFRLVQKLLPLLETNKSARNYSAIVNISSMYGMVSPDPSIYGDSGMNNPPFYGMSKAAIIQMSRYLACHLASRGIRTNTISPGPFPPQSVIDNNPEFHKELCKKTPLNRVGQPDEVANAVHFLLSDKASYINGVNLPVDGGWTAW